MTRLRCTFLPQEWIGDTAYPVLRDRRPNQWTVQVDEVFMEKLTPFSYESDQLRDATEAPKWVREWDGPFEVEYEEIEESQDPGTPNDFVEPWMSDPYEVRTRSEIVIGEDRVPMDVLVDLIVTYGGES